MLLTDANILLEVLLNRAKAADARRLLDQAPFAMAVTDFAFHSVCVHLGRSRRAELYPILASLFRRRLDVVSLTLSETLVNVPGAMRKHGLDFDDAYQYTAAEKFGLTIVSFDQHFDGTPLGRRTPEQILNATQD